MLLKDTIERFEVEEDVDKKNENDIDKKPKQQNRYSPWNYLIFGMPTIVFLFFLFLLKVMGAI